jgi:RNA-dependent RNA polymerase
LGVTHPFIPDLLFVPEVHSCFALLAHTALIGWCTLISDTVHVIWQQELVTRFNNSSTTHADTPQEVKDSFNPNPEAVETFLERTRYLHSDKRAVEIQKFLLVGLKDISTVGVYSNMHDIGVYPALDSCITFCYPTSKLAVYKYGYSDQRSIRLAHMFVLSLMWCGFSSHISGRRFCQCLDGIKTGLQIKPEVLRRDQATFKGRPPAWKETAQDQKNRENNDCNPVRHIGILGKFVMDSLKERGEKLKAMNPILFFRSLR